MQLRKRITTTGLPLPLGELQWGRNFAVAETYLPKLTVDACTPLQWGRNFAVAETGAGLAGPGDRVLASMGPQLCSCGNSFTSLSSDDMYRLQWGRNFAVAETSSASMDVASESVGFNGAATLQLRKLDRVAVQAVREHLLQWGRNFAVAETAWSASSPRGTFFGFNGAATLQLRKRKARGGKPFKESSLQWGRNFAVAETCRSYASKMPRDAASMGPQLCSCGNLSTTTAYETFKAGASMGPQLCSCGNPPKSGCIFCPFGGFNGAATLQLRKPVYL